MWISSGSPNFTEAQTKMVNVSRQYTVETLLVQDLALKSMFESRSGVLLWSFGTRGFRSKFFLRTNQGRGGRYDRRSVSFSQNASFNWDVRHKSLPWSFSVFIVYKKQRYALCWPNVELSFMHNTLDLADITTLITSYNSLKLRWRALKKMCM